MNTIHLTDAQRDTFAACGLIVIDGESRRRMQGGSHTNPRFQWNVQYVALEGWRILTEPCDTCGGSGVERIPAEVHGGKVPMHFDCADCEDGRDWHDRRRVVTLTATCPKCKGVGVSLAGAYACSAAGCLGSGVVTLGRFTIPPLLPVITEDRWNEDNPPLPCVVLSWKGEAIYMGLRLGDLLDWQPLALDPLPRPGQFVARPERVE